MFHYVCKTSNPYGKKAVECAEEIIQLYLNGNKRESLKESARFFDNINMYLFGKNNFAKPTPKNNYLNELEDLFGKKIKTATEAKWNEYSLAYCRSKHFSNGEQILDCGFDHNASFIDWFLYECGLIEKENRSKELSEERGRYLKSLNFAFSREEEEHFKGRAQIFYRNAYRAEMYSHKVYTDVMKEGFYDMYTPLILTRMGMEQYLKAMYENTFHKEAPWKPADCRKSLKKNKMISKALSDEIYTVLQRGNDNTHGGFASYPFAIIHGIEMLKECLEYFKKNNK